MQKEICWVDPTNEDAVSERWIEFRDAVYADDIVRSIEQFRA